MTGLKRTAGPQRRVPLRSRTPLPRGGPLPVGQPIPRYAELLQRRAEPRKGTARVVAAVRGATGKFSPKVRAVMLARSGGRCECCGGYVEKGWTAQHRLARGMGGTRRTVTAADGMVVHELPCHRYIESHPTRALEMGWRIPQGDDPETAPMTLPGGRRVLLTADGRYVDMPEVTS